MWVLAAKALIKTKLNVSSELLLLYIDMSFKYNFYGMRSII